MSKDDSRIDNICNFFKVLSNPIRIKILESLLTRCSCTPGAGYCVFELNDLIELPQPYLSKHLKILKDAGILKFIKKGNRIEYFFADNNNLKEAFDFISRFGNI